MAEKFLNHLSKLPLLNKFFPSSSNSNQSQIFSLENINFKIRIGIWCVTFTSTMSSFFVENWTPKSAFIPFPMIYLFALYLLLTKKNEYILGLPMLILLLSVTAGVLEKEGVYYLRMMTSCIGFVAIYSVMSYPFLLQVIMSGGYIFIQKRYRYHLDDVYEPITNTYRISANSIHDALDGWQASLIMQFITLMVYQIIVKKIWKNYKDVKDRLEQTNLILQEVNIKLAKCGGLTPALKMIREIKNAKKKIMLGGMCESNIGATALAHLLPLADYADIDGPLLLKENIGSGLVYDGAKINIAQQSGLGILM